ncbi:hypothetical protein HS088_TW01G00276 [Tripterygium wilfordii]|uniref:Uncharacterized protein n=1 Tax=Tripterygium wilfordii TaxID=458696 RepID=A0A7J7E191_TRIWF|nr:hypothetical protein HS088_TW01G00276 [Tripterygium wilfordii]
MPGTTSRFDKADNELERASCSDNISSSHVRDACNETTGTGTLKDSSDLKDDGGSSINSMSCETVEDAISGLEELVNQVKWLKTVWNAYVKECLMESCGTSCLKKNIAYNIGIYFLLEGW